MFSKLGFFGKDIESKGENVTHECGPRILRFFDALPNFSFITWETALLLVIKMVYQVASETATKPRILEKQVICEYLNCMNY